MKIAILIFFLLIASDAFAEKKVIRKTQHVGFDGDTVDGTARTPDGAYVVQKRAVDFVPLYKVREQFDENIKKSVDYLK